MMIDESATAVQLDGTITVVHFQMKSLCAVLARGGFRKVEQLRANSLPPMRRFDEQFIDPGALAAIFQAEVETNDQIGDGSAILADQINDAMARVEQKFGKILSYAGFVERLGPWIVVLHVAHQEKDGIDVGKSGKNNREWHETVAAFRMVMMEPTPILSTERTSRGGGVAERS
jgi:hypothetical protein